MGIKFSSTTKIITVNSIFCSMDTLRCRRVSDTNQNPNQVLNQLTPFFVTLNLIIGTLRNKKDCYFYNSCWTIIYSYINKNHKFKVKIGSISILRIYYQQLPNVREIVILIWSVTGFPNPNLSKTVFFIWKSPRLGCSPNRATSVFGL